ncbi:hypothetical protein DLAC_03633 [Tieghemostelium lacteum]|uniref:Uncharacterized protein n=1 Tax=Tieghemostelium lacteum TaxID=361077 RepID=A0A152A0G5_TIELA|nr:hypothetical protein DLAC_03633 [Tieghemostelium lacteum]|eukprot:KYQ99693.1 hypothetical protein DLAC_03633 [Tieghemostelium lacteum]
MLPIYILISIFKSACNKVQSFDLQVKFINTLSLVNKEFRDRIVPSVTNIKASINYKKSLTLYSKVANRTSRLTLNLYTEEGVMDFIQHKDSLCQYITEIYTYQITLSSKYNKIYNGVYNRLKSIYIMVSGYCGEAKIPNDFPLVQSIENVTCTFNQIIQQTDLDSYFDNLLSKLTNLRVLTLQFSTESKIKFDFSSLLSLSKTLEELSLYSEINSNDCIQLFTSMSNLKSLSFTGILMGTYDWSHLFQSLLLHNQNLENLYLSTYSLFAKLSYPILVSSLNCNKTLKILNTNGLTIVDTTSIPITNNTLIKIHNQLEEKVYIDWSVKSNIQYISIPHNYTHPEFIQSISNFHTNLTDLEIIKIHPPELLTVVSTVLKLNMVNLTSLTVKKNLSTVQWEDGGKALVDALLVNRYIKELKVTLEITGEQLSTLLTNHHPSLTSLSITSFKDFRNFESVIDALKMNRYLIKFILIDNPFDNSPKNHLMKLPKYLSLIQSLIETNYILSYIFIQEPIPKADIEIFGDEDENNLNSDPTISHEITPQQLESFSQTLKSQCYHLNTLNIAQRHSELRKLIQQYCIEVYSDS